MQQDAWRTYLELALGLTEKPRKRAKQAIDTLAAQSGASVDQLRSMTEELVETSVANREAVAKLVRSELDKALRAVGLVNADRLTEMQSRIDELEHRLAETEAGGSAAPRPTGVDSAATTTARKTAAKKAAATKASASKTSAKKAAAKKAAATKASASKTSAKKAAATKVAADTPAAPKTAAKKAASTTAAGARKTGAKKAGAKKAAATKAGARRAAATKIGTETTATERAAESAPGTGE